MKFYRRVCRFGHSKPVTIEEIGSDLHAACSICGGETHVVRIDNDPKPEKPDLNVASEVPFR